MAETFGIRRICARDTAGSFGYDRDVFFFLLWPIRLGYVVYVHEMYIVFINITVAESFFHYSTFRKFPDLGDSTSTNNL